MLRLLRGEGLDGFSWELGVLVATLASWKEAFLAADQAGLKSREPSLQDEENARLKQALGDREMRLEICRQAAKLRGYERPFTSPGSGSDLQGCRRFPGSSTGPRLRRLRAADPPFNGLRPAGRHGFCAAPEARPHVPATRR